MEIQGARNSQNNLEKGQSWQDAHFSIPKLTAEL